jgi:hypothetical protein
MSGGKLQCIEKHGVAKTYIVVTITASAGPLDTYIAIYRYCTEFIENRGRASKNILG